MTQTHEAITQGRKDLIASREGMQHVLEKHQETIEQYGQMINSTFNMLSSLPPEFPPRLITDPCYSSHKILQQPTGMEEPNEPSEKDTGVQVRGLTPHVNSHTPMSRLETPLFDGSKPR